MPVYAWVAVILLVLSVVGKVFLIGYPREPISGAEALVDGVCGLFVVWVICHLAGVLS